jgi:hypothetical protein
MRHQSRYGRRAGRGYGYEHDAVGGRRREPGYGTVYMPYGTPFPVAPGFGSAHRGWGPLGWMGWGPEMEYWPYVGTAAYAFDGRYRQPRKPPEESPTYGRQADRAVLAWARRYGYELEYRIDPRLPTGPQGRRRPTRRR